MRPPKQKQPEIKKGLCRVQEYVDVTTTNHFVCFFYRREQRILQSNNQSVVWILISKSNKFRQPR